MARNDTDEVIIVGESQIVDDYASRSLKKAGVDVASGGAAGALLTLAVNTWVKDPSAQSTLLYVVPTVAVVLSLCARFVGGLVSEIWKYSVSEIVRKSRLKKVEKGIKIAIEHRDACDADTNATAAQKKECRDQIIRLRKSELALVVRGAVVVK